MSNQNYYEGVQHIVRISSNELRDCQHCDKSIGGTSLGPGLDESVNHYIDKHGYKLLHIGSETTQDGMGNPWHCIVAVVGK